MTNTEQVTSFVIRRDWFETPAGRFNYFGEAQAATDTETNHIHRPNGHYCETCRKVGVPYGEGCKGTLSCNHSVEMAKITDLCAALNTYLKSIGLQPDEYGFNPPLDARGNDATIPEKHRWLIAFVVEGASEGWYCHLAAVMQSPNKPHPEMVDLGLAKTYSPENAYALAREAQRFLTATAWN